MGSVIKICILAVTGVLVAMAVKQEKSQYGFLIGLTMGIFVLGSCAERIRWIAGQTAWIKSYLGEGSSYLGILLKVMGIIYVCDFSAGICRDAGYGCLAGQLEMLGKLTVLIFGTTVLTEVIDEIMQLA